MFFFSHREIWADEWFWEIKANFSDAENEEKKRNAVWKILKLW